MNCTVIACVWIILGDIPIGDAMTHVRTGERHAWRHQVNCERVAKTMAYPDDPPNTSFTCHPFMLRR